MGNSPEVLNVNQLFLNLNRFNWNWFIWPPVLPVHSGKLDTNSLSPRLTTDTHERIENEIDIFPMNVYRTC